MFLRQRSKRVGRGGRLRGGGAWTWTNSFSFTIYQGRFFLSQFFRKLYSLFRYFLLMMISILSTKEFGEGGKSRV